MCAVDAPISTPRTFVPRSSSLTGTGRRLDYPKAEGATERQQNPAT